MNDLPRPWLLAALADIAITDLARQETQDPSEDGRRRALPRADQRRRRLADWRWASHRYGVEEDRLN